MRTLFNTTFPIRQLHIAWGWLLAVCWYATALIYRLTLQVERHGTEHLEGRPNHILVFWHENLPIYFHVQLRASGPQVWMQHPALFMTPVHAMLRLMGVKKLAFGSSGNGGRQALDEVISYLKEGYSTVITPDGPHGPVKQLKPGAMIMAAETGIPIVPVTFSAGSHWTLPTWDRKIWPRPFSKIVMDFHPPITVERPDDSQKWDDLLNALNK
ncbi:MAG: DUF374 domain-containing protein [Flavobacteriales bacterium]|nr:DUF374 domain-containing protein [Flavobacteriales bacterium]